MPSRQEIETYGILIGGGLAILTVALILGRGGPRWTIGGRPCDDARVEDWVNRWRLEGRITLADAERLLRGTMLLEDWLRAMLQTGKIDVQQLLRMSSDACPS